MIKAFQNPVRISLAVLLILVFLAFPCAATCLEKRPLSADGNKNEGDETFRLSFAVKTVGKGLVSPLHWEGGDFTNLAIVLGAGLFTSLLDDSIREWTLDQRSPSSNKFFKTATRFGDGVNLCAFMAGLYAVGGLTGSREVRKTALICFESFLVSGAFSSVLKFGVGRARPEAEEGRYAFHPFSKKSSFTSFPSGHSSAIWSVATVIADRTDVWFVDVLCYGTAAITSLSRVHQDKHWASDVLLGSALGFFTAKKICALNRAPKGPRLSASFNLIGKGQAITLSLSF
jgi:membrane-associated phospholipid phosphatase